MSNSGSTNDDLKKQADEAISDLPAETAAGNADPAGGSQTDPEQYEKEHGGQYADGGSGQS
jgi:hypothetical protein